MITKNERDRLTEIPTKSMIMELAKRHSDRKILDTVDCLDINQVLDIVWDIHKELEEYVYIIYMSGNGDLIKLEKKTMSDPIKMHLHVRQIVKDALLHSASAITLAHNHPNSASCLPSKEDVDLTCKVLESMHNLSMTLWDHIIVSEVGYFSMREAGIIAQIDDLVHEQSACSKLVIKADLEKAEYDRNK